MAAARRTAVVAAAAAVGVALALVPRAAQPDAAPAPTGPAAADAAVLDELGYLEASVANRRALARAARARRPIDRSRLRTPFAGHPEEGFFARGAPDTRWTLPAWAGTRRTSG